jgi:protein SDA1
VALGSMPSLWAGQGRHAAQADTAHRTPACLPAWLLQVDPAALEARKKRGHDKASRLATVMEGREGRGAFGASSNRKKKKTGGLSERQKQRQKAMPAAARIVQLRNRAEQRRQQRGGRKNYKGKVH